VYLPKPSAPGKAICLPCAIALKLKQDNAAAESSVISFVFINKYIISYKAFDKSSIDFHNNVQR
jgi:hypothetical protein